MGTGNLEHLAGFLGGKESKGRRRQRQVMKGREARTGAIHADGRDGGNEKMSKPSRVHGQCRAGFTRWQEVKGANRYSRGSNVTVRLNRMNAG